MAYKFLARIAPRLFDSVVPVVSCSSFSMCSQCTSFAMTPGAVAETEEDSRHGGKLTGTEKPSGHSPTACCSCYFSMVFARKKARQFRTLTAPVQERQPWFTKGFCNKGGLKRQGSMDATELQTHLLQTPFGKPKVGQTKARMQRHAWQNSSSQ